MSAQNRDSLFSKALMALFRGRHKEASALLSQVRKIRELDLIEIGEINHICDKRAMLEDKLIL